MRFLITFLLLVLSLSGCQQDTHKEKRIGYSQIKISDSIQASSELESIIKPYRDKLESEMNQKLTYSPKSLYKTDYQLNTPIGNLMADAVFEMSNPIFKKREQKKVDAVLLNYGGIRSGINKGDVTVRTAFNIMPFENQVNIAELPYSSLKKMIDYLVQERKAHPISGMQIVLDQNRSLQSATINNQPLQKDKNYYIATSDYLFNGGDNMNFFNDAISSYDIDYKLRNLFIDYFQQQDTLPIVHDKRFIQK